MKVEKQFKVHIELVNAMRKIIFLLIIISFILCACNSDSSTEISDTLNLQLTNVRTIWEQPREYNVDNFECITFGNYYQSAPETDVKEPIEWIILKKENDKALLMSRYVLDSMPYHDGKKNLKNVIWADCSLRKWLNKNFYDTAFTKEEKKCILKTHITNSAFSTLYTDDVETDDNIFLISDVEISGFEGFDRKDRKMTTRATKYVSNIDIVTDGYDAKNNHKRIKGKLAPYWLRTNYMENKVMYFGTEKYRAFADAKYKKRGVRPVIWVKFDSTKYQVLKLEREQMEKESIARKENEAKSRQFDFALFSSCIENIRCVNEHADGTKEDSLEVVEFGNYYYNINKDRKNLTWFVLTKDEVNRKALLVTKDVIDCQVYEKNTRESAYWPMSDIRKWLNKDFYNLAFTGAEQNVILDSTLKEKINEDEYGDLTDKVFLLSSEECYDYFSGFGALPDDKINNAKASPTEYASFVSDGEMRINNGFTTYWLRDIALTSGINCVDTYGGIRVISPQASYYKTIGTRPAIWVAY